MLIFFASRSARFSCRADFCEFPYANLSFFAADRRTIPFHLSLRADEGLAVCNRRGPRDSDWGTEIRQQAALDGPVQLSVEIDAPRLRILLNGEQIFSFGGLLRRRRFPDLAGIRYVEITGSIPAGSIDMEMAPPEDHKQDLYLDPHLELRGRLPGTHAGLRLDTGPGTPSLPLITQPGDTETALRAGLPGHLWRMVPDAAPLRLRLCNGDQVLEELPLGRDRMHKAVSTLADLDLSRDPGTLARVAEQLRFGGLLPRLSPEHRTALLSQVEAAGLTGFLSADAPALPPPDLPPPATGPEGPEAALHDALARLAPVLRQTDPDRDALETLLAPPSGQEIPFFLHLADPFCLNGQFDLLWKQASPHGIARLDPSDDAWSNSGLLPFLLRAGRVQAVQEILSRLAADTSGWIMTPPLAWCLVQALQQECLAPQDRRTVIDGVLGVLEAHAGDYWRRSPCIALTGAALDLVTALGLFPAGDAAGFEAQVLRLYGLSRDFWRLADDREVSLPPDMAAARARFATLADPEADATALDTALAHFDHLGCAQTDRVRRDLLGPAGVATATPTLQDLTRAGVEPGQAALRHLAFPGAGSDDPELGDLARAALPDACDSFIPIDRSPLAAEQEIAARAATALLRTAQRGTDPLPDLPGFLALLPPLSTDGLGHDLGHALLRGLRAAGASQSAAQLQEALAPLTGQAPTQAPAPADHPALAGANPIFDTLVTVFSCRANLDSRIPALRAAWLGQLAELGVPYVIVTGDGDGTLAGDILHLDAADDYEGLPQKTLATIAWVHEHTSFAHMLKVDDDCFLNADLFFHSLSYRKFDYYGRKLSRITGQLDRAWHCAKSGSDRGRLELDKSPEPSSYCDGGSGYALSRRAMGAALDAATSPQGQALIWSSFMEDKLLGDLLALRGIHPANEDYDVTLRRRSTPGGIPVPRWFNGFDPSRIAPVKLVHLDDKKAQFPLKQSLTKAILTPKKIWPSYQPARLGEATNALEMISPLPRLDAARDAPVAVVAAMRNEMFMLPHFLAHYRGLGVESFLIADNGSDDGTLEYLADQPDVALFSVDTDYNLSHYGVAWQQALISGFRTHKWSLLADADELLAWETTPRTSLPRLLDGEEFADADAVRVFMLDLYPDGPLAQAGFASGDPFAEAGFCDRDPFLQTSFGRGPFSNSPTWTSAVRHRLIPGSRPELFVAQKLALLKYRPWHRLSDGLHYAAGARVAGRELLFGHFKYNAQFHAKARTEVTRGQHFNNAEEYRKYLALLAEGRDVIFDPEVSVPWRDAPFVRSRLS